jgi:tyrosyl-tRNA synthetase
MTTEQVNKLELIVSRLKEVIGLEDLKTLLTTKNPHIYWGTAPTGRIHIGYLVPLLKIADFLKADCQVTILLADIHAMLDNLKTTQDLVTLRTQYYMEMIMQILTNLNIPTDKLRFVIGSDFQTSSMYTMDLYKMYTIITTHDAKRGGAEVVKQTNNPKLSSLVYPLMQALDEEYLEVDIQFGGIDQRKIFTLAQEYLPAIGYRKRIHLMNPMLTSIAAKPPNLELLPTDNHRIEYAANLKQIVTQLEESVPIDTIVSNLATVIDNITFREELTSGVSENKMSSSNLNSKIDFLDTKNDIKKKINSAYCLEGDLSFNPLMELVELVIFPMISHLQQTFVINRPEKYGGVLTYKSFEDLKLDFVEKRLHPQDLKMGMVDYLNNFMEPIRKYFGTEEKKQLMKNAYPMG